MYANGGEPFRKMRLAFTCGDNGAKPFAVEVLCAGQYYNVDSIHPCGRPYRWRNGHPCDVGIFNLTPLLADAAAAWLASLPARFGLKVTASSGNASGAAGGQRKSLEDPSLWCPEGPGNVVAALQEYQPENLGHDEFVRHMAAIKAALGPDREDFYPDVLIWAPGIRSTEEAATRKVWDSITDAEIGWDWLAKKAGLRDADHDFVETTDAPEKLPDPIGTVLGEALGRWVYDRLNQCWYDTRDMLSAGAGAFNARNVSIAPSGVVGKKTAANILLNTGHVREAVTHTYRPKAPCYIAADRAINQWRPSTLVPIPGVEPVPWLAHMKLLIPDSAARGHVFDWMAFVLQNRGVKIGHAILIVSPLHGVGKDTAFAPLIAGLGERNCIKIEPDLLLGRFNDYLNHELILVNEMANFEKGRAELKLKYFLAVECLPPQIEEKGKKIYTGYANQNLIMFSNFANAVKLDDEDRRVFVYTSGMAKQPDDYYTRLWNWYGNGGDAIVCGWLLERDLSAFNRTAPPPMTQSKLDMIEATTPPCVRWINEQFARGGRWEHRKFMLMREIRDGALDFGSPVAMMHLHQGHMERALRKNGFAAIPGRHWIDKQMLTVWTRDTHAMKLSGEFLTARVNTDRKR
jgi:hypothetical protein